MANPLRWLTGPTRTQIRIAVDRSMTHVERGTSRRAREPITAKPEKAKPEKKGGGKK